MTAQNYSVTGASPAYDYLWRQINWRHVESEVRRLQMRIAKAVQQGKLGKVKALQWLLTHSHNAKLLAIRRGDSEYWCQNIRC